jgi:hypothetical protein
MHQLLYLVLGLAAGVASGIFGIGGGTILIPALVYIFGFTQHQAQGTTLAIMVLPIGLLAAWRYYAAGNVKMAALGAVCLGFFIGGWLGAHLIQNAPDPLLKKLFGVFLFLVSLQMIFAK